MSFPASGCHFEIEHMTKNMETAVEKRERQRIRVNVPMTIFVGDREIPAFTRDLNNLGVYFYLALADGLLIDHEFEFVITLPPEITLSTCCRIRCSARLMRREETSMDLKGIGARILDYSIYR
jgi:hypothetical protein